MSKRGPKIGVSGRAMPAPSVFHDQHPRRKKPKPKPRPASGPPQPRFLGEMVVKQKESEHV